MTNQTNTTNNSTHYPQWDMVKTLPDHLLLIRVDFEIIDSNISLQELSQYFAPGQRLDLSDLNLETNKAQPLKVNNRPFTIENLWPKKEASFFILRITPEKAHKLDANELGMFLENEHLVKFQWNLKSGENALQNNCESFLGYSRTSIAQQNNFLSSIITQECKPSLRESIGKFIENKKKHCSLEFTVKKADGHLAWIKGFSYLTSESSTTLNCYLRDITEQKTIKEALSKSEMEKSQILNSMIDGAALIGPDYKIKYANKKFKEDYPNYKESKKQPFCYKIIHNMDNKCLTCSVEMVFQTKKFHRTIRSAKMAPAF